MRHQPTPEAIYEAVAAAFSTTVETINSTSRKREAVEPRRVCVYLLRNRGNMRVPEILSLTGYEKREYNRIMEDVRELRRLDTDFDMKIKIAEILLIQQSFTIKGLPALKISVAHTDTNSTRSLF